MDRKQIAATLKEIGVLLQLQGANPFKVRAYTNGARVVEGLPEDPATVIREGRHGSVKGIGKALREKLTELVTTGELAYLERLRGEVPAGLVEWLRIPGLGPKRARTVHERLAITTVGELAYACQENRLVELEGFGQKLQDQILRGIAHLRRSEGRVLLPTAQVHAEALAARLRAVPGVDRLEIAGSARRRRETVGDLDLVVATRQAEGVHAAFVADDEVEAVLAHGQTKSTVRLGSGIQVDLRTVPPVAFPFLLHHMTGSAAHNAALRARARNRGLKLNEYGLFDTEDRPTSCASEDEIFRALGLSPIPPELREDRGELPAAEGDALPPLVETGDVRGILHAHTTWSDGAHDLGEMARACRDAGYEYLGVSDHSQAAVYARGLDAARVRAQHREIDDLNEDLAPFRVLKGIEADILGDGAMDLDDGELLAEFDFVIASIHSNLHMDAERAMQRILGALRHPHVHILGHPTGRLLLGREGYPLDMDHVLRVAAEEGVVVELNANPHRLDLDWRHCQRARELGVGVAVNPDAHRIDGFAHLANGIDAARKGWLTAADVVNTLPWPALLERLHAAHRSSR